MDSHILVYDSGRILAAMEERTRVLVDRVSFSIGAGESLALIGETGSGKTMIALSILGLLPENVRQEGGFICLNGKNLESSRQHRALLGKDVVYIPQNGLESLNPSRKIRHQIYDGLRRLGIPRKDFLRTALKNLEQAGFSEPASILDLYPFELSGGMAQRVTIALAAGSRASLVIADEPTNGLDARGKQQFLDLLAQVFPRAGRLIITHDLSVAGLCQKVLVLSGGMAMESGFPGNPRHPYTKALLGALVAKGMEETPVLRKEPGLCPFYRRCPVALEACKETRPHHKDGSQEWWCCRS